MVGVTDGEEVTGAWKDGEEDGELEKNCDGSEVGMIEGIFVGAVIFRMRVK
jgi:hypothetical protein